MRTGHRCRLCGRRRVCPRAVAAAVAGLPGTASRLARTRFSPLIILPIPQRTGFARLRAIPHVGATTPSHGRPCAAGNGEHRCDLYLCSPGRKTRFNAANSCADRRMPLNESWSGVSGPRFDASGVDLASCCTSRPDRHRITRATSKAAHHTQTITATIRAHQDECPQPELAAPRASRRARQVCR